MTATSLTQLANCCLKPMRGNSVYEELRVKRLAVMTSRKKSDEERSEGKQCLSQDFMDESKRKVVCRQHKGDGSRREVK